LLQEVETSDVTVVGGGLAGVCAAIAAARLGAKVNLVQNRGVLGGNSSSEIRVWVCGATKHGINRYARESGIMGEFFLENQYRNPDGNVYLWDLLLLEKVKAEKNIRLFLNTEVTEVELAGKQHIHAVKGIVIGSERWVTFKSRFFIDCSGDGWISYLAGATYHQGREARSAYSESLAPEKADHETDGSTLFFYTKDVRHPVKFVKPFFAKDIATTPIVKNREIHQDDNGCAYWWIEYGGQLDVTHDNERIRDELQSVVYGIWDYIKNSGKFAATNLTLEWVGSIPGKREYRRFLGPYVLKQSDIEKQTDFKDKVAFGGWSIDIHPGTGMYAESSGAQDSVPDGLYHIPLRCIYSKDIDNLFFAGRDISASHVAFGSVRVMATCASIGEAAGSAAAFAVQNHLPAPDDIYQQHLMSFQQLLLKQDASLLGIKNEDADDLAKRATIRASSELTSINTYSNNAELFPLTKDVACLFPVDPSISDFELFVNSEHATQLSVEFYQTGKPQNYIPQQLLQKKMVPVAENFHSWLKIPFQWHPDQRQNVFVIVRKNPNIALYLGHEEFQGVLSFIWQPVKELQQPKLHHFVRSSPILYWTNQAINRRNFIFYVAKTRAFTADKLQNGYVRPYAGPNMWVTDYQQQPEWIELAWPKLQNINEIRLTFNDDTNEDIINLHHHRTPFPIIPELIRHFSIEFWNGNGWTSIYETTNNRTRHLIHKLPQAITTEKIRVIIYSTNGSRQISCYEIRVY
jgi:hypothetical protein